jgi:RNA polymerase sigma factor (sigma-70 family)
MRIYHARRKGLIIKVNEFTVKPIVQPTRLVPIGTPIPGVPTPIKLRDPITERFQNNRYLVSIEARYALKKMSLIYDLKTLEHFGTIGLWNACSRFTGDEETFPFYARVRIRGQIWDEIRNESPLPRRMQKAENKPKFDSIEESIIASKIPLPDDVIHLRDILKQVNSIHFSERERQVVEAIANGDPLVDLAISWGVSEPLVSQTKAKAIRKMVDLIQKADL